MKARKRGRPPKLNADRFPNGKIKPEWSQRETERDIKSVALEARKRIHGLDDVSDLAGYTLGRIYIDKAITRPMLEAGNAYSDDMFRYYSYYMGPAPTVSAQNLMEANDCIKALETESAALKAANIHMTEQCSMVRHAIAEARNKMVNGPAFCVLYLDGRNEHGTHVLSSFPRSFDIDDDDLNEQAEAIFMKAEAVGFNEGDFVWAEFNRVPPQVGYEGRVELSGYWDFAGINADMSQALKDKAP